MNDLDPGKKQAIINFIRQHPDGVISTVNADGNPEASVVYFSVDNSLNISFTTKQRTRKAQNIEANANVAVAIHQADEQKVVTAAGNAHEVTDPEEAVAIYRKTVHSAQETGPDSVPPIARLSAGDFVVYTITPEHIDMLGYSHGDSFANAMEHANDAPHYGNPN